MPKQFNEDFENSRKECDKESTSKRNSYSKNRKKKGSKTTSRESYVKNDASRDRLSVDTGMRKSMTNDVRWYAQNPELLRDSSSMPYGWPLGYTIDDRTADYEGNILTKSPGILTARVALCPGVSKDNNSAVNVAARNIYSFVRHANSGHANYDSPDLMLYLLAMDEVYAMFYYGCRTLGTSMLFNQQNRYYPQAIVEALGFDYDDVISNLAQFRYYLNAISVKIGSMCVPSSMPILDRHRWIFSGLYTDSTTAKAQTYAYVPDGYRIYTEVESGGGKLVYTDFACDLKLKVAEYIEIMNSMINPIIGSEDMNIMSGDILKAYGPEGVFKLDSVAENFMVVPMYDHEVLTQFQNITFLGRANMATGNFDITQDNSINKGTIIFDPNWGVIANGGTNDPRNAKRVLTLDLPNVTPADTMVASRLTNVTHTETVQNVDHLHLTSSGTEIATFGAMRMFDPETKVLNGYNIEYSMTVLLGADSSSTRFMFSKIDMLNKFDYHPPMALVVVSADGNTIYQTNQYQELDNYTVLDEIDLGSMHETAVLSEFNCPQMGSFNTKVTRR